jgi:hypothetical protein
MERIYYSEFVKALPIVTLILTACAKYRDKKLILEDIGGVSRVMMLAGFLSINELLISYSLV